MRDILQRLLRPADPVRLFCTVTELLPAGRYLVTDDQGRRITVDGDAGYLPGEQVIVQAGRITRRGSRPPVRKTYRV